MANYAIPAQGRELELTGRSDSGEYPSQGGPVSRLMPRQAIPTFAGQARLHALSGLLALD